MNLEEFQSKELREMIGKKPRIWVSVWTKEAHRLTAVSRDEAQINQNER